MPEILTSGVILSFVFFILGILIYKFKCYFLIPGYSRASESQKKDYVIEGLAQHIRIGLIALSVLLMIAIILFIKELQGGFIAVMGVFLFIAAVIPLGAPHYMPEQQRLMKSGSMSSELPVLFRILPEKFFRHLELKTHSWIQVCQQCGHEQDFWEAESFRGGKLVEPIKYMHCRSCKEQRLHKIRKKNDEGI